MAISVEAQAFILVIAAGLCTMIGASVVFFPSLANLAKPNILATALGFAAGIMLYISMVDIWGKSVGAYSEAGHDDGDAVIYATLSFFGGCLLMILLDLAVDKLLSWDHARATANGGNANVVHASLMGGTAEDADALNKMRTNFENKVASEQAVESDGQEQATEAAITGDVEKVVDVEKAGEENETTEPLTTAFDDDVDQLKHMGWAMAAAIAIHNFPEGMVTYLAYTNDSSVGIALAVGIAIHNIPEGLCVAMPLYYATGRRWYSFMWGTLSGLTEPLGALLVYLVLYNGMSGNVDGILFGLVGGMMTVISIDELIPTAHKYSSNPKHVTYAAIFGMLFIASSLMLFEV